MERRCVVEERAVDQLARAVVEHNAAPMAKVEDELNELT